MERDGGDVQRFLEIAVVQVIVGAVFAHVGAHTDGVEHEVHLSAEDAHAFFKNLLQILHAGGVGGDDGGADLLGEFVKRSHSQRHGSVGERQLCTFFGCLDSNLPSDAVFVERAKDDAALSFQ